MRILLLPALLLWPLFATATESPDTSGLTSVSARTVNETQEGEETALKAVGDRVRRIDEKTLELRLDDQKEPLQLINQRTLDQRADYYFDRYLPEQHLYILAVGLYEGSTWLLIDSRNGEQLAIYGDPILSPDGSRLVASNIDMVAMFDPNGLQVIRLTEKGPVEEFALNPEPWGPVDPQWADDRRITFTKRIVTGDNFAHEDQPGALVLTEDETWQLEE